MPHTPRQRLAALLAAAAALLAAPSALAAAPQVLVRFAPGTTGARQASLLAAAGLTRVRAIPHIGVVVARPSAGATAATAETALAVQPQVAYAEREGGVRAATIPSDPSYTAVPWTYTLPNVPGALDIGLGSATVYVLDSGVDPTAPDLAGATAAGYDTFSPGDDPVDDNGHGTRVAGTIAARAGNGLGGAGVCPGCTIVPVKVLDSTGYGPWSNVAAGLVWATDQGARIVNLSLNSISSSQTLEDAVAYAVAHGVLVVAAGGNDTSSTPSYPSSLPGVLGVAGSDWNDRVYNGSNYGSWLELAASGCYETTQLGGGYTNACGTSIAAPFVAGVAALMISHNGTLTKTQIEDALRTTARPVAEWTDGSANYACPAGGCVAWGRVDAAAAVASVSPLPAASSPPVLNGTAKIGEALTVDKGTWDGAPTGYSYDFRRCDPDGVSNCASVQTGSQSSYVPVAGDYAKTIVVRVLASNAAGTGAATSAAVAIGAYPPSLAAVDLTGSTLVNQPLSTAIVAGSLDGTAPISVAYSWRRCDAGGAGCVAIPGQTAQSYLLTLGDLGATVRLRVTATNLTGSVDFDSAASDVVTAVPIAPTFGAHLPTLTGATVVGTTLSATQPTATGTWPVAYTDAWTRCDGSGGNCTATGVTGATYTLAGADAGKTLRYTRTATNGGGTAATNVLSGVVTAPPPSAVAPSFGSAAPTLTGTTIAGQTLTASQPTATGSATIAYTGAWTRCDAAGASCAATGVAAAAYLLTAADVGETLRYTLTATNGAGSASASALSAVVTAATVTSSATATTTTTTTTPIPATAASAAAGAPDLSLLVTVPATAAVGTNVHLTFTVRGRAGTGTAAGTQVSVVVPPELHVTRSQAAASTCTLAATVVCTLGSVTPGADAVAELWAEVVDAGSGLVTLKTTVTSTGADANLSDNIVATPLRLTGTATPTAAPAPGTTSTTTPATASAGGTAGPAKKPTRPAAKTASRATVTAVPVRRAKGGGAWAQLPLHAKVTAPGGRVRYQWQVQLAGDTWVSIAGATGASYTPDASLAGSRLRVVAQTAAGSVASAATARLKAALRTTPAKAPRIGSRLRARLAASVLAKGARVRYRWQLLDHGRWLTIVGATKATYTPNRGAAGRNLRVVATADGRTLAARATPPVRRAAKR